MPIFAGRCCWSAGKFDIIQLVLLVKATENKRASSDLDRNIALQSRIARVPVPMSEGRTAIETGPYGYHSRPSRPICFRRIAGGLAGHSSVEAAPRQPERLSKDKVDFFEQKIRRC